MPPPKLKLEILKLIGLEPEASLFDFFTRPPAGPRPGSRLFKSNDQSEPFHYCSHAATSCPDCEDGFVQNEKSDLLIVTPLADNVRGIDGKRRIRK